MFATWGRFVYRFRWPVLILSILSLAGWAALMSYSGTLGAEDLPSQTEAGRANELIESELGRRAPSFILVFSRMIRKPPTRSFARRPSGR
ncbi:MAG: hypothetical protein AVDCRST_MAG37-1576 [uncultured Rubrobacteraceae bacterium]|uniref:Uncharacterized protein n=1 Tax=uncultured Rubrobacteraceae bacterium TaxID=349277 RepID=A0A6J4QQ48_9ACTN|nr:MAG: hypothetical protein AVDCRST_MAG37-1576 [uncultured Rubrobacteraceae bacterium]